VARKEQAAEHGKVFDSISICLNKGLGCPIGSVLLGRKEFIRKARRIRKVFGGGMRQAGFMAAAGIYALEHNIERLSIDHGHAEALASVLGETGFVNRLFPVETNILIAQTRPDMPAASVAGLLLKKDIQVIAISSDQIRFVTHLGITESMMDKTLDSIRGL
jgi:threonine aldolase